MKKPSTTVIQNRVCRWRGTLHGPCARNRPGITAAVSPGSSASGFTDKAVMEKYLQGRIKAYSHLFTEISPPIPKEFASYFKVNGLLLPGYRIEGQEQERPSALGRLAAAKETVARKGAEKAKPERIQEKKRGETI